MLRHSIWAPAFQAASLGYQFHHQETSTRSSLDRTSFRDLEAFLTVVGANYGALDAEYADPSWQ